MLFTPFLELKIKQNLSKVKDHTIGMGLACSNEICKNLGGETMNVQSEKGLTLFSFKLNVNARKNNRSFIKEKNLSDLSTLKSSFNDNEELSKIQEYTNKCQLFSFIKVPFNDQFIQIEKRA